MLMRGSTNGNSTIRKVHSTRSNHEQYSVSWKAERLIQYAGYFDIAWRNHPRERLHGKVLLPILDEPYGKAIQAASAGWMKALVVKNLEVAIKCIESLKRTKLGRVKIVPLDDLELPDDELNADQAPGIIGPLSKVIRSDRSIAPAVQFVFGDTILATTQRAAFLTAAKGQRCVVTSGDLYEPGGGLESGYYRAPLEISNIVPRSTALETLEKTVKSLETVVQRSRSDVDRIETELDELLEDRVSASKTREALAKSPRAPWSC